MTGDCDKGWSFNVLYFYKSLFIGLLVAARRCRAVLNVIKEHQKIVDALVDMKNKRRREVLYNTLILQKVSLKKEIVESIED